MIAGVLLLLNTYPLLVSEDLVFRSKETTMTGSVSVMVYSLSGLNRLTQENVEAAMAVVEETGLSRILVTDSAGLVLYDTRETGGAVGKYTFYSEIVQALEGNDAFSSSYRDGAFRSRASSPVLYQNRIIGAVYAYEYDTEQAALLEGLQTNLMRLSVGIALAVVLLSVLLSRMLTRKIGALLTAIRQALLVMIWRDVTRSNRYRRQLEEANRFAEELLASREKLMLAITHDFKAPLGSIMGYADLLSRLTVDGRQRFYLDNMKTSSEHLLKLVTDLLDFHRLDLNKAEINRVTFHPARLLEEIYVSFEPLTSAKGLANT